MITVFLRGGIGNQMFQYALGLHLAKRNNTQLVLDTVHLSDRFPRKNFTYRTFDLDVFMAELRLTPLSRVAEKLPIPGAWLGIDLMGMGVGDLFGVRKVVREKGDFFQPEILNARGSLLLYGRWQSEKYFADIADDVRHTFRFRCPLEGEAKALAERIGKMNSVSLHVRRGDYAAFANVKALMGETGLAYYSRAAAYVAGRVKEPHYFVFSDDSEWCKKNIALPFPTTYLDDASRGPKAAFHLELMSLCKHHIIANSSFSWWGAWLDRTLGKIVVAPKNWYADGLHRDADVVPETWIRL